MRREVENRGMSSESRVAAEEGMMGNCVGHRKKGPAVN